MNTVYDYIAQTDPNSAKRIIENFGYTVTNAKDMGANLKTLVNNEGEGALLSIMEAHPDKDIILELFTKKEDSSNASGNNNYNTRRNNDDFAFERGLQYANASGAQQQNTDASNLASNTNTMIFASALILAVAIIFKNDK